MQEMLAVALQSALSLALAVVSADRPKKARLRIDPALCDAASVGDLRRVKQLLAEGVSPDSADEEGVTALMAAVFAAQVKVVRTLLKAGADPDEQDASGLTALINAVMANGEMALEEAHPIFLEIVNLLLAAGADAGLEDQDGYSAIDHARSYGLEDLVDVLKGALHP